MKLGILGGTFDPIHQGHLLLAENARSQFNLDKVIFVPAFVPPHKANHRDMTPAPYRYKMVEIALQNRPHFQISDLEFNRPDISYTVDTLQTMHKLYPKDELFLIVGGDSVAAFSSWRDIDKIQQLATLLAARRPGFDPSSTSPVPIRWIDMPECGISSTQIREQLLHRKVIPGELPAGVEDYIRQMHLYEKGRREFTA